MSKHNKKTESTHSHTHSSEVHSAASAPGGRYKAATAAAVLSANTLRDMAGMPYLSAAAVAAAATTGDVVATAATASSSSSAAAKRCSKTREAAWGDGQ